MLFKLKNDPPNNIITPINSCKIVLNSKIKCSLVGQNLSNFPCPKTLSDNSSDHGVTSQFSLKNRIKKNKIIRKPHIMTFCKIFTVICICSLSTPSYSTEFNLSNLKLLISRESIYQSERYKSSLFFTSHQSFEQVQRDIATKLGNDWHAGAPKSQQDSSIKSITFTSSSSPNCVIWLGFKTYDKINNTSMCNLALIKETTPAKQLDLQYNSSR